MDDGSLVLTGGHWVACPLPCCEVLTCSWSRALRRLSGSTVFPRRPEVLAGLLTPVIPSQLPSISQLSPSSVEGFLFLSVLLPSLVLYRPHFTLGGGGTILCDIFKDLMSPPFSLGRSSKELFMFLQKPYYFDKMSGHSGSVTVEETSSQNKTLGSSTSWFLRT